MESNFTNGTGGFTNDTESHEKYSPEQIATWEMMAWGISGGFTFLACLFSLYLILKHLQHWTFPAQQRYIVRLLLMVPIYSIDSWLSIRFREYGIYFDTFRDCYEAYVIYQFFGLLTTYIEGDNNSDNLFKMLESKPLIKFPMPLCFLRPFKPSLWFLIIAKQCILQYVVIKPIVSVVAAVLEATGNYHEGSFRPWYGYVYCTGISLASVTLSMYFLVWFYVITEEELAKYRPIAKFLCVKSIIFFAFWQSVLIAILSFFHVIVDIGHWKEEEISRGVQDFIICIEMFLLSIAHIFVFDYESYVKGDPTGLIVRPIKNFKHVLNQGDMVKDMKSAYNPKNYKEAKKQYKETKQKYRENFVKEEDEGVEYMNTEKSSEEEE